MKPVRVAKRPIRRRRAAVPQPAAAADFKRSQIIQTLLELGFKHRDIYTPTYLAKGTRKKHHGAASLTFFQRHQWDLKEWLERAHQKYRARMKQVHPDRNGGRLDEAVKLNAAWARVKYLFGRKGVFL